MAGEVEDVRDFVEETVDDRVEEVEDDIVEKVEDHIVEKVEDDRAMAIEEEYAEIEEEEAEIYFSTEHVSRTQELELELEGARKEIFSLCSLLGLTPLGPAESQEEASLQAAGRQEEPSLQAGLAQLGAAVARLLTSSNKEVLSNGNAMVNGNDGEKLSKEKQLEVKLQETEQGLDSCSRGWAESRLLLKTKELEVTELSAKLAVSTTELAAAQEENKLLQEDLEKMNVTEDQEQMRRDMDIRNEAVKEKNMAWIELSKTKVGRAATDPPTADGRDPAEGGAGAAVGEVAAGHADSAGGEGQGEPQDQPWQMTEPWSSAAFLSVMFVYWSFFIGLE